MVVTKKIDQFFDPSVCAYKLSGKIREHIDHLLVSDDVLECTKSTLRNLMDQEEANKNTLNYDMLTKLHKYIQRADREYTEPFYQFLEKCKCIEPKPRENKLLDVRLKILRLKHSQSLYDIMAASVDKIIENKFDDISGGKGDATAGIYSNTDNKRVGLGRTTTATTNYSTEFRKLNGSAVAVFNSFLVFICTFIFCYKALEYSLTTPNIIAQVLFGLAGSTIVAFAELYFLIRVL